MAVEVLGFTGAKKRKTHGGARKGAGRKPLLGHAMLVSGVKLTPEVIDFLDEMKGEDSRSILVESLIRESRLFRDWESERQK